MDFAQVAHVSGLKIIIRRSKRPSNDRNDVKVSQIYFMFLFNCDHFAGKWVWQIVFVPQL